MLVALLIQTLYSSCIIGTDTWLHVYTKSVPMPYLADVKPAEAGAAYQFSRALSEDCWSVDESKSEHNSTLETLPCSVKSSGIGLRAVRSETINSMLLNHSGSSDTIYRDIASGLSFIGSLSRPTISLKGDEPALSPRFNASTFAMSTTCHLVTGCMPPSGPQANGSFTCGSTFSGPAPRTWFNLSPWKNSKDFLNDDTWNGDGWAVYAPYPSFQINSRSAELIVDSDSGIVEGSLIFLLKCVPSLSEIEYTWANGTFIKLLTSYEANTTLRNIIRGPFLSDYPYSNDHLKSFAARLGIGTGTGIYPMRYYTRQYAALLRDIGLSFLGGSIEPRPAISLQVQNETVVTQVPKSALFVLISFNLWYAFLGFCLFLVACYVTAYGGRGADIRAVQQLLTSSDSRKQLLTRLDLVLVITSVSVWKRWKMSGDSKCGMRTKILRTANNRPWQRNFAHQASKRSKVFLSSGLLLLAPRFLKWDPMALLRGKTTMPDLGMPQPLR